MRVLITFKSSALLSAEPINLLGGTVLDVYSIAPIMVADVDPANFTALRSDPNIVAVEPDGQVKLQEIGFGEFFNITPTVEPTQRSPWGITKLRAAEVHAKGNTGAGIRVAVIDTGIAPHPDLVVNIKPGINFVTPGTPPIDDHSHGTHCSGTIAAALDADGIFGMAPNAELYPVKILNSAGSGSWSAVISAYQWCIDNKMQVTNNSYGGTAGSVAVEAALNAAVAAGIVMVFAAGNTGGTTPHYPGSYPAAIAVSATDETDTIAVFSTRGPQICVAAPGVNVESTVLGGLYGLKSGTSMACPHVVGAVALLLASGVTSDKVRGKLEELSIDKGAPGYDPLYGFGRVDAYNLVFGTATTPEFKSPIVVDGSSSSDADGTIVAWNYAVSDGQKFVGMKNTIILTPGTYSITLTVIDNRGESSSSTRQCKIVPPSAPPAPPNTKPVAAFTITQG